MLQYSCTSFLKLRQYKTLLIPFIFCIINICLCLILAHKEGFYKASYWQKKNYSNFSPKAFYIYHKNYVAPDVISCNQKCTTKVYSVPKGIFFFISGHFQKMWPFQLALLQKYILEYKYQKHAYQKSLQKYELLLTNIGNKLKIFFKS